MNSETLILKGDVSIDDAGTVTGIAWPFGSPDSVGDVIEPGAFNLVNTLPMVMEHDQKQVVGVWETAAETDKGLEVKGRLFVEGIGPARDAHRHLKAGRIGGLSIGFRPHGFEPRAEGGRVFKSLTVTEISLCRSPLHPGARVTIVKSKENHMEDELENAPEAKADPVVTPEEVKALKARLDKIEAKANRPKAANDNRQPAANDNDERKAFATFVRSGDAGEVKSLGYATPSTGGILAPEQVSTSILEKVAEFSPMRSLAQTISMAGALLQLPRLVDEVTVGEVAETAARPESEPTFDQIDLKAFEMAVIVPVTRILLEDAQIDLAAYLGNHIARRFGQKEAGWFVKGNGTSQAEGVLTSTDVAEVEADIAADDLIDLFYSIKTAYSSNGSWLMNRKTMAVVRKLKDTDGSYIWQPALTAGQPPLLLGRPVYEGVDMPDPVAGNKAIVFGDFATGYAIADRVGFEIIRDDLTGAANGIVKLHARRRVGGRVVMGEALTKLKVAA
ncbi:phage major capsid protein [Mesorhizobium sp. M7A.F.Ca.US.001.04.1.1]|uniref:phage major capsid protein n=1 Tax=unclassified Mesorhizobium TaxID=325217 RepID=UPI000FCAE3E7|nr:MULTISPECIES: phage major capsid protein [unclassified Mesorhizobium]RUY31691.1 phage major capsid protein [Mesorhizobium sp. M7A.F.Ca.US.001.04.2.1]RUY44121.1 phage major capsid protein [Mesorhizobium sp. M7A.F.Ca.US.001.04.1.1]